MEKTKEFLVKYLPHMLLSVYLVKMQVLQHSHDSIAIIGLCALTGYRMYINSVFDKKVSKRLEDMENKIHNTMQEYNSANAEARQEIRHELDENHNKIDEALQNMAKVVDSELSLIKTDLGQINLSQKAGNDKRPVFF